MAVSTYDKKRYTKMEPVLQYINKNFITVNDNDVKKANPILKHVLDKIIAAMKSKSILFENLFTDILYGGSYFDGLKVGKPEEFDIDLRLVLPKLLDTKLELSNQPGFVTVSLKGWSNFEKSNEFPKFKGIEKFKDDKNFLLVNEVLRWMESIINQALNTFDKVNNKFRIPYNGSFVEIALKKSGPALTTLITYENIYMDVDLVAVFKFSQEQWPPSPFKAIPGTCEKKDFMIVPKSPKVAIDHKERCWRMSFQEQEKVLILGKNTCKTALRMIKKLRDTQNHNQISSYFIKTVFLHEIDKQPNDFWNSALSFIFMHMLKTYQSYLENYKIPYYWNTKNNLLQGIDKTTIDNFKNFLSRVVASVDKKLDENPYIIADYLSTAEERTELLNANLTFSTKQSKDSSINNNNNNNNSEALNLKTTIKLLSNCTLSSPEPSIDNTVDSCSQKNSPDIQDKILSMLQQINTNINILQSDMKFALKRISDVEYNIQELKNDNVIIKDSLKNSGASLNVDLDSQSYELKMMSDKIDTIIIPSELQRLKHIEGELVSEPQENISVQPENKDSKCIIL